MQHSTNQKYKGISTWQNASRQKSIAKYHTQIWKIRCFLPKFENKVKITALSTFIIMEVLASVIRQEKEIKDIT